MTAAAMREPTISATAMNGATQAMLASTAPSVGGSAVTSRPTRPAEIRKAATIVPTTVISSAHRQR